MILIYKNSLLAKFEQVARISLYEIFHKNLLMQHIASKNTNNQ